MRLHNVPRLDLLQTMEDLLEEIYEIALTLDDPDSDIMITISALRKQLEELIDDEDS